MLPGVETIRLELHCHSTVSDGAWRPEVLADRLAASGVAVASLTDHDSIAGLPEFRSALADRGVGFIAGIEITAALDDDELHLLAYGFDPSHAEVRGTWGAEPPGQEPDNGTMADALRRRGLCTSPCGEHGDVAPANGGGHRITAAAAIRLIHQAGGKVFLAHPFAIRHHVEALKPVVAHLMELGLDGIEALYGGYTADRQAELVRLAEDFGLLICAGSDVHFDVSGTPLGLDVPVPVWKAFRNAIGAPAAVSTDGGALPAAEPRSGRRLERRHFILHIVCPTVLAVLLAVLAIFGVLLPAFERSLLDRKRETIRELVASAWSVLAEAEQGERSGERTREQAQELARSRIAAMRYGREGKDYFWLQDMHPRIVMHPYRRDLEGQDVTEFRDPKGQRIFVEFARLVRRQHEGYVEYVWQWKDDPQRLEPKESYVRGFEPWGWVIGTGIYLDDVRAEIARLQRTLVLVSLAMVLAVAALLLYVLRGGLELERERSRAEEALQASTNRYRSLVEAATEGTLLVLNGRLRYANPVLLKRLGYGAEELDFHDLHDLLPAGEGNQRVWEAVTRVVAGDEVTGSVDGALRTRGGAWVESVLTLSPITFAGEHGFILNVREVSARAAEPAVRREGAHRLDGMAESVPVGIFRARLARRGAVVAANTIAFAQLGALRGAVAGETPALADLFGDDHEWDGFRQELETGEVVRRRVTATLSNGETRVFAMAAVAVRDATGDAAFIDGALDDVSAKAREDQERDAMLERLRASLLFLHEPVRNVLHPAVVCTPDTSVPAAAALLSRRGVSALVVHSERGEPLGLVSDREIRTGLAGTLRDAGQPVRRIMSSPLHTLADTAPVYEALLLMEEHGVEHLVVEHEDSQVLGVVDIATLLRFQSYGALVLAREIVRAESVEEVAQGSRRTVALVTTLLRCGARPRHLTRMIASVADAAGERLVTLASDELGPPPCEFALFSMGSQARHEQTLATDQDNAIVFADTGEVDEEAVRSYFLRLGQRVCGWLDVAGYRACRGEVMASNPRWCQSLSAWKETFAGWIREATPAQLVEMSIFFDLRLVYGTSALITELRRDIQAAVAASPDFVRRLARSSLEFRPPARLFGRILPGGAGGEHPGRLDLKDAALPIVTFARVFALHHGLPESNTEERLRVLAERDRLAATTRDDVIAAFDFLMRLRLEHQSAQILAGQAPDNVIQLSRLSATELTLLKQAFTQIEAIQRKTSFELLGGT